MYLSAVERSDEIQELKLQMTVLKSQNEEMSQKLDTEVSPHVHFNFFFFLILF